jgi:hypothetical protein
MHIFKCFENQSDTYHDTLTHYLMDQDPLLLKDQADGMEFVATDKVEVLKKKDGPSRARLKSICLSVLHVYDLWASRHNLLSYT